MATGDVTAAGSKITIVDLLFPQGFVIDEASDDVALISVDNPTFATVAAGLNGHKISWNHASVYTITIGVIPNSQSDENLKAIARWTRIQQGNIANVDSIQAIFTERDGTKTVFADCTMTEGAICNSVTTEGRYETRQYVLQGTVQVL